MSPRLFPTIWCWEKFTATKYMSKAGLVSIIKNNLLTSRHNNLILKLHTNLNPVNKINKLSVIIPAYNKDSEVFMVVSNMVHELKKLQQPWEIIVVDDASKDKTLREALKSKKFNGNTQNIKVYSYNLNQGKGFALYYGFKQSTGDTIVFMDSDLDLPATNLPVIINNYKKSNAHIVISSKRQPLSQVSYPLLRRIQSKTYQTLIKILFNLNVSDTQVGLKVFKREVLEECFPRIVVKAFAFDLELLVVAKLLGFNKIVESPIILNYNFTSTTNITCIKQILNDTLAIFYRKNILNYYEEPHFRLEQNNVVTTRFPITSVPA